MSLFLSQNELFVGLDTGQVIHYSSVHQPQTTVDFRAHQDYIWAIRAVDRNLFTASADTSIRQWDLLSNRCLRTFSGHSHWVLAMEVLTVGAGGVLLHIEGYLTLWLAEWQLISSSRDGTVRHWQMNGNCIQTYPRV
jgi:WD40 repeat protein